jgi:hypothetical protein
LELGITAYHVDFFSTPMASRSQADVIRRIKLLYEDVAADDFSQITSVLGVRLERRIPGDDMVIGPKPELFVGKGVYLDTIHKKINGFPYTRTGIILHLQGGKCIRPEDIRRSFPSDVQIEDNATSCDTDANGPRPCFITYWRSWNNSVTKHAAITNPYVSFTFDHSSCVNNIDLNLVSPIPPGAATDSRPGAGAATLPPYPAGR